MAGTGRRLTSTTAREAARKRWAKRVAIASPAPQGAPGRGPERDALAEEALADLQGRTRVSQIETMLARERSSSSAPGTSIIPGSTDGAAAPLSRGSIISAAGTSSSPAPAIPGSTEVTPAPPPAEGGRVFSSGAAPGASGPVAEVQGSSRINNRPAAQVQVSPQPASAAPPQVAAQVQGVQGPALQCCGCDLVVPAALQAQHSCKAQPEHQAFRWRAWKPRPAAAPAPVITMLRHHCGQLVPVALRAEHRCPPGTLQHWGTDAEAWTAP